MISTTAALQDGRRTLERAAREMGLPLSDQAMHWLLGQAWPESRLGMVDAGTQFDGTNNWGAVYWYGNPPKPPSPYTTEWKPGRDTNPGGVATHPMIAVYPTQLDGAKGFLAVYQKYGQDVLGVLANPGATPYDLARGLYKHGYFTGCHLGLDGVPSIRLGQVKLVDANALAARIEKEGDGLTLNCAGKRKALDMLKTTQAEADDANIREYAQMISNGANLSRQAAGQPPVPLPHSTALPSTTKWFPLMVLGGMAGLAWWLTRNR